MKSGVALDLNGTNTWTGAQTFSSATVTNGIKANDGTALAPAYSFSSDSQTGFYRAGTGMVNYADSGGVLIQFDPNFAQFNSIPVRLSNRTAVTPSYSFINDINTGFYLVGANTLGISVGTSQVGQFNSSGLDLLNGADLTVDGGGITFTGTYVSSPSAVQSVRFATTTISPSAGFVLIGSTGNITISAVPTISTSTAIDGQQAVFLSTAATVTFQDDTTRATSGLELGTSGTVTISTSTARRFIYFKTISKWVWVQ